MKILFFDGHCNLCNGFINFLVLRDKERKIKYAPLQGSTAAEMLPEQYVEQLNSVVLLDEGVIYTESEAALRALKVTSKFYGVLLYVPEFFRNMVYRFVAKNRYKIFGRSDTCRVPSEEERQLFLS